MDDGTRRPAYRSWESMKHRCLNQNSNRYKNYGARGIVICERWLNSFSNFYEDMGDRPDGTFLERIDNDGNYEKSNCKWASCKEQANNRRSNHRVEFKDETHTLFEWAEITGIKWGTLLYRINNGWPIEKAFTMAAKTPNRKTKCA